MTFIASITHGLLPAEDGRYIIINTENESKQTREEVRMFQTTIDSLLQKNERLNNGFLELYDDRSMMSIEMDKLIQDNKYLKRITR